MSNNTISYTVLNQSLVKEQLELDYKPVGLNIEYFGDDRICAVEPIPRNNDNPTFPVGNNTLKLLLNANAIKQKE